MSNLVKVILFVAFAIFVVGFVWAIVVAVKRPKETASTPTPAPQVNQTVPTPSPAPAPTVTPVPVSPAPTAKQSSAPARRTTRQYTTRTYIIESSHGTFANTNSGAWAHAGVDANGNAYAEAHAY